MSQGTQTGALDQPRGVGWGGDGRRCRRKGIYVHLQLIQGFPCRSAGKESACNAGDLGLIPGSGRSPGEGIGNALQYPCLETPMDRGAWWAAVPGVTKSWTQVSD